MDLKFRSRVGQHRDQHIASISLELSLDSQSYAMLSCALLDRVPTTYGRLTAPCLYNLTPECQPMCAACLSAAT